MIYVVVGARPNFVKAVPLVHALRAAGAHVVLVHTGQHYDVNMSESIMGDLGISQPDVHLGTGGGTHAQQTSRIMIAFEDLCVSARPAAVVVVGDVNSTLACAIASAKLGIPVAHLEAGLRSGDRSMPEELNRIVADHLSDLLLTTEASGEANLKLEGLATRRIVFVGNCMIDSLVRHVEAARANKPWEAYGLAVHGYGVITLHRPALVDDAARLRAVVEAVDRGCGDTAMLFPAHPRTAAQLEGMTLRKTRVCGPLGYIEFLGLLSSAAIVVTDSGGIQEETTALGVRCLTVRENTERPVTVTHGTNRIVGTNPADVQSAVAEGLSLPRPDVGRPPLWDGNAGPRAAAAIAEWLAGMN
jgi:UDP-N-acetylglucosamine 2-epimerase (non-hydrolysing)